MVSKKTKRILCTHHDKGKTHDFKVLRKSKLPLHEKTKGKADSGYQGMKGMHKNTDLPQKGSKHKPLTEEQQAANKKLANERVTVEHVIARLKVFKMLADRYRKARPKHAKRVKLICGIYNHELN